MNEDFKSSMSEYNVIIVQILKSSKLIRTCKNKICNKTFSSE